MQGAVTEQLNEIWSYSHNKHSVLSSGLARRIVEQAVATAFQVQLCELRAPTRRRAPIAFARQVAMYLVHVAYGFTLTEVGVLFARDRTTVAYACGIVEDRRDDPMFDIFLDHMEISVVRLANALNTLET